jgi:hypothetical protein
MECVTVEDILKQQGYIAGIKRIAQMVVGLEGGVEDIRMMPKED